MRFESKQDAKDYILKNKDLLINFKVIVLKELALFVGVKGLSGKSKDFIIKKMLRELNANIGEVNIDEQIQTLILKDNLGELQIFVENNEPNLPKMSVANLRKLANYMSVKGTTGKSKQFIINKIINEINPANNSEIQKLVDTNDEDQILNYIKINKDKLMNISVKDLIILGKHIGASGMSGITKSKIISKILFIHKVKTSTKRINIPDKVFIIFDTETTLGFNSGRLLQIGYEIYKKDVLIFQSNDYVKQVGFKVTGTKIHNITDEILKQKGIPVREVVLKFINSINKYHLIGEFFKENVLF
jgi:hypothetical protein